MAGKRNRKSVEKRVEEGCGQGRGADYKPTIWVRDFSSKGFSSQGKGWKTGRDHHFLSLNELRYFYVLEWMEIVTDIREQFPLFLEETLEIARLCGIEHSSDDGKPLVMTTDFVITVKKGMETEEWVRTCKTVEELQSPRTLEKLEIDRRYWQARGMNWGIVTEREIPGVLVANMMQIHDLHDPKTLYPLSEADIRQVYCFLTKEVLKGEESLIAISTRCDTHFCLEGGTSLTVAQHLIATRQWLVDINCPLNTQFREKLIFLKSPSTELE
jgi:hypothetical protein